MLERGSKNLYDTDTSLVLPSAFVQGGGVQQEWLQYYAEVSRCDSDVGKVVDELRQQGELEPTVIIVMSDNGRPFLRGKTWIYDEGVRTHFIVY